MQATSPPPSPNFYARLGVSARRCIVDTNVLLDACFIAGGSARRALDVLRSEGASLCIDPLIEEELANISRRLRVKHALQFEPFGLVAGFIESYRFLHLPPGDPHYGASINKRDRHVLRLAQTRDAFLLTADARLVAESLVAGGEARMPSEVLWALNSGNMRDFFHVLPPSRTSGTVFARMMPGMWADSGSPGRFTVCEIQNVVRLAYDNRAHAWLFETAFGLAVALQMRLAADEECLVCGTYSLRPGKMGLVRLFAGAAGGSPEMSTVSTVRAFDDWKPGTMTFGQTLKGADHWNGHLRQIAIGPQTLTMERWRALQMTQAGSPSPLDEHGLERALVLLDRLRRGTPSSADVHIDGLLSEWRLRF